MKTLRECKDQISKENFDYKNSGSIISESYTDLVAELYAQQFKDEISKLKQEKEELITKVEHYMIRSRKVIYGDYTEEEFKQFSDKKNELEAVISKQKCLTKQPQQK